MKSNTVAPMLSFVVCGLVLLTGTGQSRADIDVGGDATGLFVYDLEEFKDLARLPDNAFVTLSSAELGIIFGEKLVGQVVTSVDNFDVVTGTPTVPLMMDASIDAGVGISPMSMFASVTIIGLGALGFPDRDAIGEGALTVLYDEDQRVVALDVLGTNGGTFQVRFFNRSGEVLGEAAFDEAVDDTYVFGSDAEDIAAFTVTSTDKAGLAFDNFRFIPSLVSEGPTCNVNGPYLIERQGDVTEVPLNGEVSGDTVSDSWEYLWTTDCPGGTFDDEMSPTPTLFVDTADTCHVECSVTLTVDDGIDAVTCATTVTVEGPSEPPTLMVDTTPIVVEDLNCSGDEFVMLPAATAVDANGAELDVITDAPEWFTAGETTTVTYTAVDDCGHTATTTVDVTVLYGSGVEVHVSQRTLRGERRQRAHPEPLVGVTVEAYDSSRGSCVWQEARHRRGISHHTFEDIVAMCEPVNTAVTYEEGVAPVDVPPGKYVVIAQLDRDGDGIVDEYLGRPAGHVHCGQWKTRRLVLLVDADGNRVAGDDG